MLSITRLIFMSPFVYSSVALLHALLPPLSLPYPQDILWSCIHFYLGNRHNLFHSILSNSRVLPAMFGTMFARILEFMYQIVRLCVWFFPVCFSQLFRILYILSPSAIISVQRNILLVLPPFSVVTARCRVTLDSCKLNLCTTRR